MEAAVSLQVRIGINGHAIEYVVITNEGPIDGRYAEGDHAGGDGVRRYSWVSDDAVGFVDHARGDGAKALVIKVLAAIMESESG